MYRSSTDEQNREKLLREVAEMLDFCWSVDDVGGLALYHVTHIGGTYEHSPR